MAKESRALADLKKFLVVLSQTKLSGLQLRLVLYCVEEKRYVPDILKAFGIKKSNLSAAMKPMIDMGLIVRNEEVATTISYTVNRKWTPANDSLAGQASLFDE